MSSITINVNDDTLKKMNYFYHDYFVTNNNVHALFIAKVDNCTVTAYKSKKVLFQGTDASKEASIWTKMKEKKTESINSSKKDNFFIESIGSDEVGTGDYFGPVVVVASYIDQYTIDKIKSLKIDDSKKILDTDIYKIAPTLFKLLPYSLQVVNNIKYNEVMNQKGMNLNKLKAMLHKQAITKLIDKINKTPTIIIDQFCSIDNFNKYVGDTKFSKQVDFHTKAESKYASVACASIMARYIFLEEMEKLSKELNLTLQKGASSIVDEQGIDLVNRHGTSILNKIAKLHFKNTDKILTK